MDDDDLIRIALRAAMDHILELDGEKPLTDDEWDERPDADPEFFASLVSAGRAALLRARQGGMAQSPTSSCAQRPVRPGRARGGGHIRVRLVSPQAEETETGRFAAQLKPVLAMEMLRAAMGGTSIH